MTPTPLADLIERLVQLAEAATPGPWFADRDGGVWRRDPSELYQYGGGIAGDQPLATATVGHFRWENQFPLESNAAFIAAANPEAIKLLCATLTAQAEEIRALREAVKPFATRLYPIALNNHAICDADIVATAGMPMGDFRRAKSAYEGDRAS